MLKLARAVRARADDGAHQVVFYDWGVGSYNTRLLGGLIGLGLHKDVKDCYRFLMHNYHPGDQIFLFGFSRGAYTVRSLAMMLTKCGVLACEHAHRVAEAFELYRDTECSHEFLYEWRRKYCIPETLDGVTVEFIGVWDTVGALGNPRYWLPLPDQRRFFNTHLVGNIVTARHALALNEKRRAFVPTLWTRTKTEDSNDDIQQVWFAGAHGDVGGGYPITEDGLASDSSLAWMVGEAHSSGLGFSQDLLPSSQQLGMSSGSKLHEPHKSFLHRWFTRRREIPPAHSMHLSVLERFASDATYRPLSLTRWLEANGGWGKATQLRRVAETREAH